MSIKIIADSSHDMNKELKAKLDVEIVPFKLYIDEEEIVDDEKLDIVNFIDRMVHSAELPRTACPSPNDFMEHFKDEAEAFVITISAVLSGTYNSAKLAKQMYLEEKPEKKIHIFNSKTASIGETLISVKIRELMEQGINFDGMIKPVEEYIDQMKTFFISDSLNNLIKNGRIPSWKGKMAMALKIMPIMGADDEGNIKLFTKARGANRAIDKLVEMIEKSADDFSNRVIAISHVNNLDRALKVKERVMEVCNFKDVIIVQTAGLSSLYCDNQGIIVSY